MQNQEPYCVHCMQTIGPLEGDKLVDKHNRAHAGCEEAHRAAIAAMNFITTAEGDRYIVTVVEKATGRVLAREVDDQPVRAGPLSPEVAEALEKGRPSFLRARALRAAKARWGT